jgi:hypothetical protein
MSHLNKSFFLNGYKYSLSHNTSLLSLHLAELGLNEQDVIQMMMRPSAMDHDFNESSGSSDDDNHHHHHHHHYHNHHHPNHSNNLPRSLKELNLANNHIVNTTEAFLLDNGGMIQTNLRVLDLTGNPLWSLAVGPPMTTSHVPDAHLQWQQHQQHQQASLWQLVKTYPHLGFLGCEVQQGVEMEAKAQNGAGFWTFLQHSMDLNCAGRCLYDFSSVPTSSRLFSRRLPASLLPLVLERAQRVLQSSSALSSSCENSNHATSRSASAMYGLVKGLIMEHLGGRL